MKQFDINFYNFGHLTIITSLHYLVRQLSRNIKSYLIYRMLLIFLHAEMPLYLTKSSSYVCGIVH